MHGIFVSLAGGNLTFDDTENSISFLLCQFVHFWPRIVPGAAN
jgi:hypothetical protein